MSCNLLARCERESQGYVNPYVRALVFPIVKGLFTAGPPRSMLAGLLVLACPLLASHDKTPKRIKATQNPPQYVAFSKPLSQTDQFQHALDRLTFGARPGDLEALRQIGIKRWVELQLHPERVPQNPVLESRLQPFECLRLNIHDTYTHYPPPQMIAAVARGRTALPDDPELRAIVVRLAEKYIQKKNGAADVQDDSDLDLKVKLSDILTPEQIRTLRDGEPDEKRALLERLPADKRVDFVWALKPPQRRALFNVAPVDLRRALMLSVNPQNVVATDLAEGKLLRAVYSTHQLDELLVDFWFNHFNVFINKGADRFTVPTYEREAIRPYVFGKFYDMLLATAKSPAMLFYLDNWQSVGNDRDQAARRNAKQAKRGLNENYGRELMELHTLGVDGGYTQQDVINVARCFTGWTIAGPAKGGGFEYNDKVHDKREKFVLGHIIPAGGGMNDGLEVLNILAHSPQTAHHISLELAKRFVADNPPPSLVNRMMASFLKSDGDLREVTRVMVTSPEFWSEGAYRVKVKTPFEMIVSAVRATDADVTSAYLLSNELNRLGEPLYRKLEPTGYSNANEDWVSSAGLLERMNFALALSQNRILGLRMETPRAEHSTESDSSQLAAMIGSPEFQRR